MIVVVMVVKDRFVLFVMHVVRLLFICKRGRTVELLVCFFVAVGANRFRFRCRDHEDTDKLIEISEEVENEGEKMNSFYPKISSMDWVNTSPRLQFRQELVHLDYRSSITSHMQARFSTFLETAPDTGTEKDQIPVEPDFLTNPFSGYCLFRLSCPSSGAKKSFSGNIWKEIVSQTVNFESCSDLLHLSFRPQKLEELREVLSWLQNNQSFDSK
jgi:hypothetical protein